MGMGLVEGKGKGLNALRIFEEAQEEEVGDSGSGSVEWGFL
jgi:hypothetical protein